jgi:DMSO reductase anchor subunit
VHPALSVILFTTASGAGYGLLILLAVFAALGLLPAAAGFGIAAFATALGLVTLGLLASTFHLGRPERAWRAFSQWRSSWLSREGVAAVATYLPALGFAIGWIWCGTVAGAAAVLGLVAALGALATLVCTGMIYASLPTIQRWHNGWVVPNYLALGIMAGAVLLDWLTRLFGVADPIIDLVTLVLIVLAAVLKLGYWRHIDGSAAASTPATATGLGAGGAAVRLLEAPHTEENYLMREMGFQIARKHAARLRRIALEAGFGAPFALALLALLLGGWFAIVLSTLAVPAVALGLAVERWLFFAEARHTVMLYYGAPAA